MSPQPRDSGGYTITIVTGPAAEELRVLVSAALRRARARLESELQAPADWERNEWA